MSQLISQLMSPALAIGLILIVLMFIGLYVISIIWVARDAFLRDANWKKWAMISAIPIGGIIAYCLLRPPLMQIDRDEQELEIAVKQRELMKFGECARCGYPVESTYVLCPNCHQRLKNLCPVCHHALDAEWTICPFCTTVIQNDGIPPRKQVPRKINPSGNTGPSNGAPNFSLRTRKPQSAAATGKPVCIPRAKGKNS